MAKTPKKWKPTLAERKTLRLACSLAELYEASLADANHGSERLPKDPEMRAVVMRCRQNIRKFQRLRLKLGAL